MQDNYVGDIGDYGKYGLLRVICAEKLSLSVNWYKVITKKIGRQDDGKYISYLSMPQKYKDYDSTLFDSLFRIVHTEKDRRIEKIEQANLFSAKYFSDGISTDRTTWHQKALCATAGTNTVFLDPDNGLETHNMFLKGSATEKHVKWSELKDYYERGQNVILYQHRPQMTKKETCIKDVLRFQKEYLKSDFIMLLEFPKYTNRFYFMFIHKEYQNRFEKICDLMDKRWGRGDFCKKIDI